MTWVLWALISRTGCTKQCQWLWLTCYAPLSALRFGMRWACFCPYWVNSPVLLTAGRTQQNQLSAKFQTESTAGFLPQIPRFLANEGTCVSEIWRRCEISLLAFYHTFFIRQSLHFILILVNDFWVIQVRAGPLGFQVSSLACLLVKKNGNTMCTYCVNVSPRRILMWNKKKENGTLTWISYHRICPVKGLNGFCWEDTTSFKVKIFHQMMWHLNILHSSTTLKCLCQKRAFAPPFSKFRAAATQRGPHRSCVFMAKYL